MTAEIAILNQKGVALAADSAVTIGENKIFSSANKVFMLSKYHPVGIMIYGNASFLDIDWETIIKYYREILNTKAFDSIKEYGYHFLEFLQNERFLFPEDYQKKFNLSLIRNGYNQIIEEFLNKSRKEIINSVINKKSFEYYKILKDCIEKKDNELSSLKLIIDLEGKLLDERIKEAILNDYTPLINTEMNNLFASYQLKSPDSDQLINIAKKNLLSIGNRNNGSTGVVISGYGNKDIFPSLISFNVEGIIHNNLKYLKKKDIIISHENKAFIEPFAQTDMVNAFVYGIDPYCYKLVEQSVKTSFEYFFTKIADDIFKFDQNNPLRNELLQISKDARKTFLSTITNDIDHKFYKPLLDIITTLPKIELANMAGTLVNLTSFKRKMSRNAETVGGPVDVVLITKGDGFIWINRKHYFKPELNSHFFSNYYKRRTLDESNS